MAVTNVIPSEPNHPWAGGVEKLLSVELITLVRERLSAEGAYCQWFAVFFSEPGIALSNLSTFEQVLPHVRTFSAGSGTVSILASREPLEVNMAHIASALNQFDHRLAPRNSWFTEPHLLLATEVLNEWALATIAETFPATQTFKFPAAAASAPCARVRTTLAPTGCIDEASQARRENGEKSQTQASGLDLHLSKMGRRF